MSNGSCQSPSQNSDVQTVGQDTIIHRFAARDRALSIVDLVRKLGPGCLLFRPRSVPAEERQIQEAFPTKHNSVDGSISIVLSADRVQQPEARNSSAEKRTKSRARVIRETATTQSIVVMRLCKVSNRQVMTMNLYLT